MRVKSEERWVIRLSRALALLADRLDDPPSLQELAASAGSSPYHFHRVWRALMGESVGHTIDRLRIAASQQRMVRDGSTVTEASMEAGFGTPQSFARAFRRITGMSPTEFVARKGSRRAINPIEKPLIRVELRSSCRIVVYRREGGAYRRLNELFQIVWGWAQHAGKLGDLTGIYGIPHDDPISVPEPLLRYDAGLAVGDVPDPPAPFRAVDLPAGTYAALRHNGSYDDLEGANQALIDWVLGSGYEPANFPMFHHFLDDPDVTATESLRADAFLLLGPQDTQP